MAAYKSEFLAQHYKGRLHPLQHYIFGFADRLARYSSLAPTLTNAILNGPITSPLIKRVAGFARERQLPRLAPISYQRTRRSSKKSSVPSPSHLGTPEAMKAAPPQSVLLWPDTWNNYYYPQSLSAAESVLTLAGFRVETPRGHICCGRPLYDFGLLSAARSYLAQVLDQMTPQIDAGLPFVFLEPSCASVFKDELLEFFPSDSRARLLSERVWLLADFLATSASGFAKDHLAGSLGNAHILIHGHCHHKAVFGGPANEIALLHDAGAQVEMIDATCCGMAGPFGFEARKFEVSKAIANMGLLPAIESTGPTTIIVADGFSCREQIGQFAHKEVAQTKALHFAEVLADACRGGGH
jgi:Fe-S oxidoreductase